MITDFGLPIRYVDAVNRLADGPPWWVSGHHLHDQPAAVAEKLLDELAEAEPEQGFFDQGAERWRAFTAFVLASTCNVASAGGPRGWGIGLANADTIAISLSNGGLLAAGSDDTKQGLAELLTQWRESGEPDLTKLKPSFAAANDGWTVRPELGSRV